MKTLSHLARWLASPKGFILLAVLSGLILYPAIKRWSLSGAQPAVTLALNRLPSVSVETKNDSLRILFEQQRTLAASGTGDLSAARATLTQWLAADAVECVNYLHSVGALGLFTLEELAAAVCQSSAGNPELAMRRAREIESGKLRDSTITIGFQDAVASQPTIALELAGNLPAYLWQLKENLGKALGKNTDRQRMESLFRHKNATQDMVIEATKSWFQEQPAAAAAFLEAVDPRTLISLRTFKSYIWDKLYLAGDSEFRRDYFARALPTAENARGLSSATGELLARNPQRWDELASTLKSPSTRNAASREAAVKSVKASPAQALDFVQRIPGFKGRAEAAKHVAVEYVLQHGRSNPAGAAEWLQTIKDPIVAESVRNEFKFQRLKLPERKQP